MLKPSYRSGDRAPSSKQRGRILAAGFLAAALVFSVVSLLNGQDDDESRPVSRSPLSEALAKGSDRPQGCRTDDADRAVPKAAPADLKWQELGGSRVPTSASAGPTRSAGPVRWCFARTPMGAVLAAHVIPAQMTGPDWRAVVEEQVQPGLGRDLFLSQRSSIDDSQLTSRQTGSFAGFAVRDYDDKSATVNVLIKSPQGAFVSTMVQLRWSSGDWKVEPGSDGGLHSKVTTAGGTDGFVQWEA
ncbi:hypothetical protein [Streptomyces sp. NPDC029554]|uniref:hypothetical protein n=1 Tax=Streptomyces sp. NPDC029554 TaxID=3155126 RepID=UPI0033C91B30